MDSNLTEEDIKVFQRRKAAKAKSTPTPVQAEAAEDSGPRFQSKRKVEDKMEKDSQSAAKKNAKIHDSQYGTGLSKKKERLSFDEDEWCDLNANHLSS